MTAGRAFEVESSIDIAASAETVWRVFTELDAYAAWNPFIRKASGSLAVGDEVNVRVQTDLGIPLRFHATVLWRDEGHGLHWRGSVGPRWLACGAHDFKVERVDAHHCRFTQRERFSGILPRLAAPLVEREARRGFERMNRELAARAERVEAAS